MRRLVPITVLGTLTALGLFGCGNLSLIPHYENEELVYIAEEGTGVPASQLSVVPGTFREQAIEGYDLNYAVDFRVNSVKGAQYRCNFTWHTTAFDKNYHNDVQCTQISGPTTKRRGSRKSSGSGSAASKMKDG